MEKSQHDLADLLLDVVFLVKEDGEIVFVNEACFYTLGYEPSEMIGHNIRNFLHPDDALKTNTEMVHITSGRPRFGFENRYLRKDGRAVHLQWSAHWSTHQQLRIGVARDITERKRVELRQSTLLEIATLAHNAQSLDELCSTFDTTLRKLMPLQGFAVLLSPDMRLVYYSGTDPSPCTADWYAVPMSTSNAVAGQLRLELMGVGALFVTERDVLQFAADQAAAVIQRFALQAELIHAARHDELTGLPNRRLFQDRMQTAITRSQRNELGVALLFIDLDGFKNINDQYGHGTGDNVLKAIAARIADSVRAADTVARLGGDEFVVLLEGVISWDQAKATADKISNAIELLMALDGLELRMSASIGIAQYPLNGNALDEMIRYADNAMYIEKAQRKRLLNIQLTN
jgi:diguanylate cyclase (GGDEF)-like protein/PAS domain S-box-containing protein